VGVEAAGRGASPVVFVEKDRKKIPVLKKNIAFVEEQTSVRGMDVMRYLKSCTENYNLIYLDPPFAMAEKEKLIRLVEEQKILSTGGRLLLHHPKGEDYPEKIGTFFLERTKSYGGSILRFYRNS